MGRLKQPKADLGAGLSTAVKEPYPPGTPLENGEISQAQRAMSTIAYFISGATAVNLSQFLGAPLSLINEEWYNAWIAYSKQSFGLLTMTMTQFWAPTIVRVSGDESLRGQLFQTADGNLLCNFPQRILLMANHQIYTDWLYLWWIAYTANMHGRLYIVLKESLKRIPVLGWGMQFSQFIFLKRNWEKDKPNLAAHLQKLNKASDPMWLMLFPEGTNLAPSTREASKKWADKNGIKDMKHQLLPRSTGLQFMLQELRKTVRWVYDCTIAYEGVPPGEYAQDIFTMRAAYFQGRPPKSVNMYWRRFDIATIPIDDDKAFDTWLRNRWTEKDQLLQYYHQAGKFPADEGSEKAPDGRIRRGAGYIETEIKAFHWYEFLQVFAPIGLFALVLFTFYGALPSNLMKSLNKKEIMDKLESIQRGSIQGRDNKLAKSAAPVLPKKTATPQKIATNYKSTQEALPRGGSIEKVAMQATTTKKPPHMNGMNGSASKTPAIAKTPQKASTPAVSNQQAQSTVTKKIQQPTTAAPKKLNSNLTATPATKQPVAQKPAAANGMSSAPKKPVTQKAGIMNGASPAAPKSAPKRPVMTNGVSPAPKKVEANQPANAITKTSPVKQEASSAPKKLNATKPALKPQQNGVTKQAPVKKPSVKSETASAPTKKLDVNQKTATPVKKPVATKQNPSKPLKKKKSVTFADS
ncbi:MAG: hypothetical protein M1827_002110 [Pycnora praestabilis]|nr:MAG: hypothetical protein M1827_002110 [Pycnora praestabilis]